jgi:periplasmic divalent cation tolerance protein
MTDTVIVLSTAPAEAAPAIAQALVGERLAACVNRIPGVLSTYIWEGAVVTEGEELLLIKTTAEGFERLKTRLLALHPYELPEIVALPVGLAHTPYLDWIKASVVLSHVSQ